MGKRDRNIPDNALVYSNIAAGHHSRFEQHRPIHEQHHATHQEIPRAPHESQQNYRNRYVQDRELAFRERQSHPNRHQQWQTQEQNQRYWSPSNNQPYQQQYDLQQRQLHNQYQLVAPRNAKYHLNQDPNKHVSHPGKKAHGQLMKRNTPNLSKTLPGDKQQPDADGDIDSIFASLL